MQKRIAVQAAMAFTAIALTVIMIFAMTAAWYTNIVHTSGLTFEVETWGFNGNITSEMASIVAGPGDEGLIDLEVDSASDSPSAVSVSFSKALMPEQIQQRIFFYVDTQVVRNEETVERVYLNSRESYTYNLFSQGKLTLTETVHNAPQLKWHWVYDVLGYYVQGNPVTLSDGLNTETFTVTEYLRPIEYDYDKATMAYSTNENGDTVMDLKTVDGVLTPEQFLVEFSKTDGYAGVIDPNNKRSSGYYPVDVDENGNGVYAYLCSYSQIQQNTAYDTALGQRAQEEQAETYTAKLMVSAQKTKNTVINVTSLSSLSSAIKLGAADSIQLSSNVAIGTDQVLTVGKGQRVMLDLNGNSLIANDPDTIPIVVEEGGSLTMVNGSLVYDNENGNSNSYAIQATGAEIVMSGVTMEGFKQGLRVSDQNAENAKDSTIRLVKCDWTTEGCTLLVHGNGIGSAQRTQVIIEESTLHSNSITLSGNGNNATATSTGSFGTDIQIINSTVTSNPAEIASAIYHPQRESVLTIYNSTISGYTGIAIKGGTVNIIGSRVTGSGNGMNEVEKFSPSGFNDTGDAVYIETNYNYPIELNITDLVTVTGETTKTTNTVLSSTNRYALRVYDPEVDFVDINIVSGTFEGPSSPAPDMELFATYLDPDSEMKTNYVVTQKTQ